MEFHSTNYFDTFIEVAEDCQASTSKIPPNKGNSKTIANLQFEIISKNPYKFSSDDVLFQVYAYRIDLIESEFEEARKKMFSKGQACFRSSPLTKQYGWGIHCNNEGKIALFGIDTSEYSKFIEDSGLKKVKAMRNRKTLK